MKNDFNVMIGLIVHTDDSIERVSEIMGTTPSNDLREGNGMAYEALVSGKKTWIYRMRFNRQTDTEPCIRQFVSQFPEFSTRVSEVKKIGDCTIRMSIVSLYAQVGFSLSAQELQTLSTLNIPFEITLLSFGNCFDDGERSDLTP